MEYGKSSKIIAEELIGICSPWGRAPSRILSNGCASLMEGIKFSGNLNQFKPEGNQLTTTSNHVASLRECHLPPIGFEFKKPASMMVDQLPSVTPLKGNSSETFNWPNRKGSLPSCIKNTSYISTQPFDCGYSIPNEVFISQHGEPVEVLSLEKWRLSQNDEGNLSSGYQSESLESTKGKFGESRNGTATSEQNSDFLRRVSTLGSNFVNEDSVACRGPMRSCSWTNKASYHIYSKRNEMDHYYDHPQEKSYPKLSPQSLEQKTWSYVNHHLHIPPPAMRSSFTTSIEAPDTDAYKEIRKREHAEWLRDLEKQRDEQRKRKELEKEERTGRAKWGDRGVVVGHLWEPDTSPNPRLPPTTTTTAESMVSPRWSQQRLNGETSESGMHSGSGCGRLFSMIHRSPEFEEMENGRSESNDKMEMFRQHQEGLRIHMEESQQKFSTVQSRTMEEAEEVNQVAFKLERLNTKGMEQNPHFFNNKEKEEESKMAEAKGLSPRINQNSHSYKQKEWQWQESYLERKNLITSFTLPPINPLPSPNLSGRRGSISSFEEYEASIQQEDSSQLTSVSKKGTQDFGTQTEPEEEAPALDLEGPVKEEKVEIGETTTKIKSSSPKIQKFKKERPKWGVSPPTKQYLKQSEKDPHHQLRIQRRKEREERRDSQIQRRMKQNVVAQGEKNERASYSTQASVAQEQNLKFNCERDTKFDQNENLEEYKKTSEKLKTESSLDFFSDDVITSTVRPTGLMKFEEHGTSSHEQEESEEEKHELIVTSEEVNSMEEPSVRVTDSPPVPALQRKMDELREADYLCNPSAEDLTTEQILEPTPRLPRSPVLDAPRHAEDFDNQEPEPSLHPKMSSPGLVIESSAEYFGSPPLHQSSTDSSEKGPMSPPLHLKHLIFGLQTLGSYFPTNPSTKGGVGSDSKSSIEFRIKLPTEYYQQNFQCLQTNKNKSELNPSPSNFSTRSHYPPKDELEDYKDPLFLENKNKTTMEWIQRGKKRNELLESSTLPNEFRSEEEWGLIPSEDSEGCLSPFPSTSYASSEKSSFSN